MKMESHVPGSAGDSSCRRAKWRLFAGFTLIALSLGGFGFQLLQSTELPTELNLGGSSGGGAPPTDGSRFVVDGTSANAVGSASIARNGSDILVTFEAADGATYRLERKLNMGDAWQSISGVNDLTAMGNGSAHITDPGAINLGKAFYQVTNVFPLSVSQTGLGTGSINSSPAGIDCGTDCTENYSPGAAITLSANPGTNSLFTGWGGACTGTGSCIVTMNAAKSVSADFAPKVAQGGFCNTQAECVAGLSCVDNVCCDSACTGTCEACNLAGSVGTCSAVPAGQDPANECGGVSCAAYYYGFEGDTCYQKADVTAAQASCSGSRTCRTVAQECTAQTARGSAQLTCDNFCQDPTAGTCVGTTAGTCTNVDQGSATCGLGVCQVTAPRCINGAPNTCVPASGAATTETCNGIDDNCDGIIDNGSFSDGYEPNNDCNSYHTLPTVGSNQTLTQNALTLYPSGDVDYFRINATETDSTCACCDTFCTKEDYRLVVTLTVPANAGSYVFCTSTACGTVANSCQTVNTGTSASSTFSLHGSCFATDSYSVFVRVTAGASPGFQCHPYTLTYFFEAGVCL